MPYTDRFQLADDLIAHLRTTVPAIADPFLRSRYSGFVAVAGVTVFELAIKDIFIDFAARKQKSFGTFVHSYFSRLSGRIASDRIRNEYVPSFGLRYQKRYKRLEREIEGEYLRTRGVSVLSAYNNLVRWRHDFAHEGMVPTTATFDEVIQAYELGKEVIHCLGKAMTR